MLESSPIRADKGINKKKVNKLNKNLFLSLRFKISLIVVVAVLVFSAGYFFFGLFKTREAINSQSEAFGASIADSIGAATSDIIQNGKYIELDNSLARLAKAYPSILKIEIVVAKKKVAGYSREQVVKGKIETYVAPLSVAITDNLKKDLGEIRVEYFMEKFFENFINEMRGFYFLGGGLFLVFLVGLFVLFDYMLIKPLNILRQATVKLREGDLSYCVDLKRNDEFGVLSQAFNEMTCDLKSARDELKEWNRTLEIKVDERTKDLNNALNKLQATQDELVQSGKMAAIGLIGAGVAHELNNPLTCVIGYSSMLLEKVKKKLFNEETIVKYEKYLTCIEKESKRCRGIVDSLLHFARSCSTKFEEVDLKDVVDNTLAVLDFQLRKWKIKTMLSIPDNDFFVEGNSDKLQQVFLNLISNAHTAMPDGGSVRIGLEFVEFNANPAVQVSFSDTGCGIAKDKIDKLFEAFFSSKKNDKNLGLGLSISDQIIKEHNGKISVESELGQGTTFFIVLPQKQIFSN